MSPLLGLIDFLRWRKIFEKGLFEDIQPQQVLFLDSAFHEDWGNVILRVAYDNEKFSQINYRSALLRTALEAFGKQDVWNNYFVHRGDNTYTIIEEVLAEQIRNWQSTRQFAQAA